MRKLGIQWLMIAALLLAGSVLVGHCQDAPGGEATLSNAERIARLKRSIEREQKYLRMYEAELADPMGEYQEAEDKFKEVDARWAERQEQIDQLRATGQTAAAEQLTQASAGLKSYWQRVRDQFNTLIQERRLKQETILILKEKVERDQAALQELKDGENAGPTPATPAPAAVQPTPTAAPAATSTSATPPAATTNQAKTSIVISGDSEESQKLELDQARVDAGRKESAAQVARQRAQAVRDRLGVLRRSIELEEKLLESARQKLTQAEESIAGLKKRIEERRTAGAPAAEIEKMQGYLHNAEQRLAGARDELPAITARIRELRGEERALMAEQETAERAAAVKEHEARSAGERISELENPFTVRNLWRWLLAHGPKLFLIITGMISLQRLVRLFTLRLVKLMADTSGRGTAEERENRAHTLIGVFRNAGNLVIIGGGILMLFDEVGIPIVPLMGGAAVLGLAVAFGAQNLIRDYFSGFMVLLEDQYAIGDVVRIGSIAGRVERISLRMTTLRDAEGTLHFIPHGTISTVSNMTHGWSKAVFDIGVTYGADVDQVMLVLLDLAREMKRDPRFGPLILDEGEMQGVDRFDESSVIIKFAVKTKPLQQWAVRRELLRRIKRRFDELGIQFPLPSRTIYHKNEGGGDDRRAAA